MYNCITKSAKSLVNIFKTIINLSKIDENNTMKSFNRNEKVVLHRFAKQIIKILIYTYIV